MAFPLFHLPYLALKEVLSEAGPQEIFTLSTCSQRSYRIIQSIKLRSRNWKIDFNRFGNFVGICPENSSDAYDCPFYVTVLSSSVTPMDQCALQSINIGGSTVPVESTKVNELMTYWDDVITGMKETATYFTEIFHCPIDSLQMEGGPEDSKWIIDWVTDLQKSVGCLHYETPKADPEDVSYVFSNLKIDEQIYVALRFPDELPHPEVKIPPMSLKSVEVFEASWMTLDHILAFDCKDSYFDMTLLTSHDLNRFLKHWMVGGYSRLEQFCVLTNDFLDYDTVLEGVEVEEIPRDVVRQHRPNGSVQHMIGGFDITRKSDGFKVTLINYGISQRFELVLTSNLKVM